MSPAPHSPAIAPGHADGFTDRMLDFILQSACGIVGVGGGFWLYEKAVDFLRG